MGGICEVYIPKVDKGNLYDVNSLYPSVMLNKEYPLGRPVYKISDKLEDYYGICYAMIETNQMDRGILPFRMGNILLTPMGKFEG